MSDNNAPEVTGPTLIRAVKNEPQVLAGVGFSDIDAGLGDIRVTISIASGTMFSDSPVDINVSGSGTSSLVMIGSIVYLMNFLKSSSISFVTGNAEAIITVTVNDLGRTGDDGPKEASIKINILASSQKIVKADCGDKSTLYIKPGNQPCCNIYRPPLSVNRVQAEPTGTGCDFNGWVEANTLSYVGLASNGNWRYSDGNGFYDFFIRPGFLDTWACTGDPIFDYPNSTQPNCFAGFFDLSTGTVLTAACPDPLSSIRGGAPFSLVLTDVVATYRTVFEYLLIYCGSEPSGGYDTKSQCYTDAWSHYERDGHVCRSTLIISGVTRASY